MFKTRVWGSQLFLVRYVCVLRARTLTPRSLYAIYCNERD